MVNGLTADLENLIRLIKRLARKLADDHPELTLASCVSQACSSHNNGFKTGGYSPVLWAFGADNEEHSFITTMPSEIETFGISAMNRYLQEKAKDAISRAQHTTRKENFDLAPGNLGDVISSWQRDSRSDWRSIQVRSLVGTGQTGVVWVSGGNKLIRCHPTQLRRCSAREVSIASLKGLVPQACQN